MNIRLLLKAALAVGCLAAGGHELSQAERLAAREQGRQWLGKARFGVFVHYLGQGDDWNDKVDSFDVGHFADQVARTKAGYVVFTLGQNSGIDCCCEREPRV